MQDQFGGEKMIVRLLKDTRIIEEREMDRVPVKDELIWIHEDLYIVTEVHWRQDGHASLLITENLSSYS
jgi:hypothetical protein